MERLHTVKFRQFEFNIPTKNNGNRCCCFFKTVITDITMMRIKVKMTALYLQEEVERGKVVK